ncbi:MAG: M14 family zinc carboxypeptidase, partial [Fimbriimonas sp.]
MNLRRHSIPILLTLTIGHALAEQTQDWPQTRAERTAYTETSTYADVLEFLRALQANGAPIAVSTIGTSKEGRAMPLVIASRPIVTSPTEARRSGKPIFYIQANIHAGEVEGKEAILAILRDLCREKKGVLDRAIFLITPIYNIDGNEKFGPQARNRPGQNGPESVGLRASGEGFDLNRDGIKADSLEFRALLASVYTKWEPDLMMDLHTTNGTRHGYDLTYSPPANPNTLAPILAYSRDKMLPDIRREIRKQFGTELFDYGDIINREGKLAWATFGEGGRYMTNYAGLRNRPGILSEAATYITFRDRVVATERFVRAVIAHAMRDPKKLMQMNRDADAQVVAWGLDPAKAPELGVRFEMAPRGVEEVIIERTPEPGKPRHTGRPLDLYRTKVPIYDRFRATRTAKFPAAYLIPASETALVALLQRHGVAVERFIAPARIDSLQFQVSEVKTDAQPFQGRRLSTIEGAFRPVTTDIPSGSFLVRTSQPLGILIFNMLEPESADGVVTWGLLASPPVVGQPLGIQKVMVPP